MADRNLQLDVIATWKRDSDGTEVRLRRDGRCFFWFPDKDDPKKGKWRNALEDPERPTSNIETIQRWCDEGNRDFHRVDF